MAGVQKGGSLPRERARQALIDDLTALRKGRGLSLPALQQRDGLLAVLREWSAAAGRDGSVSSAFAVLVQLLSDLDLSIRSRSLRNAYALAEPSAAGTSRFFEDPGILTARRRRLADVVGLHPDTIENYENEKILEIALTLLEGPPPSSGGVVAVAFEHTSSPMRVFVSGTVTDLDEYWRPARERIVAQSSEEAAIEILKSRDQRNRQPLLDEVSACDVYVGIIGHHFGDASADPARSATMAEYDRARVLGKQLLIYLVDSGEAWPEGPGQPDHQQFQAEFRRELMLRFSPWSFDSAADLQLRVRHDLARLAQEFSQPNSPYRVFHPDLRSVRDVFDTRNQSTRAQVADFVEFLAEQFRPLFAISPDSYNDHPILREAKRRLSDLIPEVGLSVTDGVVRRAGVRHVIMRTETVVRMLQTPRRLDAREFEKTGQEIGRSAARDLVDHALHYGRWVPSSPAAFVALWNYWDRTGGWGTYELRNVTEESWHLAIRENFLRTTDLDETRQLYTFWQGYIKGFLNRALPEISAIILRIPEEERTGSISMPPATRVRSVRYESTSEREDIFVITFERGPLFSALRGLVGSSYHRERHEYATSLVWTRGAFQAAWQSDEDRMRKMLAEYFSGPRYHRCVQTLQSFDYPPDDPELADDCFVLTNRLIQEIVDAGEGEE
ncbi:MULTISPECIES: DUF4062 domain-containing protein [Protofrankia]|uniref:DUF4062 domain-containing protein n=1 Tax=Candidatus Protofrankia datiscae TaxID=2716812 RepID=F8AYX6_9ACTN|nr:MULTISPECIES: DUF4062 domain-containing protein [Protofrankia]AEH09564.1 hypothetical protein FsymDg_2153 [Candidatus Protofrankia datiscae]